jgi:hypothetical protein
MVCLQFQTLKSINAFNILFRNRSQTPRGVPRYLHQFSTAVLSIRNCRQELHRKFNTLRSIYLDNPNSAIPKRLAKQYSASKHLFVKMHARQGQDCRHLSSEAHIAENPIQLCCLRQTQIHFFTNSSATVNGDERFNCPETNTTIFFC